MTHAAAAAGPGHVRLDADTWQAQLEELLALQSYLDEDFRLLAAPGVPCTDDAAGQAADEPHQQPMQSPLATAPSGPLGGASLDLEELLMAGPPPGVLAADGGVDGGPSTSDSGTGGDGVPALGCFMAEALVHVDVPEGGLELVLELGRSPAPPPPPPPAAPPPPAPAPPPPVVEAAGNGVVMHENGGTAGPHGSGFRELPADAGNWTEVGGKRTGGRGGGGGGAGGRGGRRRNDGRGGGHDGEEWEAAGRSGRGGGRGESAPGRGRHGRPANGSSPAGGGSSPESAGVGSDQDLELSGRRSGRGRGRRQGAFLLPGFPPGNPSPLRGAASAPDGGRGHVARVVAVNGGADPLAWIKPADGLRAAVAGSGPGGAASRRHGNPRYGAGSRGPGSAAAAPPAADAAQTEVQLLAEVSPPPPPAAAAEVTAAAPAGAGAALAAAPAAPTLVPFGASVQFLSPIRVTLTLPPDYPAVSPPRVELQALWMSPGQAEVLVSELRAQWDAGGAGAPALFTWLDWLKSEALAHLGVGQQLVLAAREPPRAGGAAGGAGPAATAAAAAGAGAAMGGPEGVALSLLRYSARREQEKFNEAMVSCAICLEEHLGARCVRLPECRDAFCAACLATHLRTQLGAGAVDNMRCPAPACRRQLPHYALQQLLSAEEFARWEELTLQRTLDKMEDLVYCPRCRRPCLEDKDHCTLCPGCFFSFCSICEESWHPGSNCLDPEARLALIEQRRAAAAASGLTRESAMERARRELNRVNELKNLALLSTTTKQCPVCAMGVEKTEGCNKMTCTYCGSYFCWRCNQVISGYDHFQQGPNGVSGCVLFEQEEIDRWNARWNLGPRAVEVERAVVLVGLMRQHGVARLCHCVVCGQRNLKEGGNNNIRCWSCNSHFCYLCRTWLRTKPGAHFGPGRCRQHSDD